VFIVIMSPNSRGSRWVEREILLAERNDVDKPIFLLLLAGDVWSRLADLQYENMNAGLKATLSPVFVVYCLRYLELAGSASSAVFDTVRDLQSEIGVATITLMPTLTPTWTPSPTSTACTVRAKPRHQFTQFPKRSR